MCLKVSFCAAPSSRKSTVCAGLETKLKQSRINVDTSREYARQYVQRYGIPKDLNEQITINENQDQRDAAIVAVSDVMLTDTPSMACYVYGVRMLDQIARERHQQDYSPAQYKFLEEMYMKALKKTRSFDLIFVFDPDDEMVQDGTRKETLGDKLEIHYALQGFLDLNCIKHQVISGSVDQKIETCFREIMAIVDPIKGE